MGLLEKINKKTKTIEITTQLFDTCPNNCTFCLQNNKQKEKYSKENLNKVINSVKSLIDLEKESTNFDLILQGGELFSDNVPDNQLDDYYEVIINIYDYVKQLNKNIIIQCNSNLLNTNPNRMKLLFDKLDSYGISTKVATSFDFCGRFKNLEDLQLFYSNLIYLKPYVSIVSMVLTKENIDVLVNQKKLTIDTLSVFNTIYNMGIFIEFEIYFPDINTYKTSLPSDNDLLNFYYYSIEHYKNFRMIQVLSNSTNHCRCACNHLVLSKGECTACIHWIFDNDLFYNSEDPYETHVKNFINKYDCLNCKFFKRCPMDCFYSHDFKLAKHHKTCIFKYIYNYLETKEKYYFSED